MKFVPLDLVLVGWLAIVDCVVFGASALIPIAIVVVVGIGVALRIGRPPSRARSKTTVLDGHYASGDFECFCFDRHESPEAHEAPYRAYWAKVQDGALHDDEDPPLIDESCRVYPYSLLPEGVERRKGRWTITITFEPEDT